MTTKKTTNNKRKAISKKEVNEKKKALDKAIYDKQWEELDIPTLRAGHFSWDTEPKMSPINKLTLVLTVVNVAILISLVIKNV